MYTKKRMLSQTVSTPSGLVTDLDGTLIPLPDHPENQASLAVLRAWKTRANAVLVFATGRHLASVEQAMSEYALPLPDWMICDVGTSIYERRAGGWSLLDEYQHHLAGIVEGHDRAAVEQAIQSMTDVTLQPPAHQQRFKISYEVPVPVAGWSSLIGQIESRLARARLPYEVTASVDPTGRHGLLDLLPRGVSKAFATIWLCHREGQSPRDWLYAGDSGNDLAPLTSGFRSIIPGNATPGLEAEVRKKRIASGQSPGDVYAATGVATSGVLEGCRHFGLVDAGD